MPETAAHIAFVAIPLHGHVLPALVLVAELVARGHRVSFAITADFAPLVEEAGASAVCYRSLFPSMKGKDADRLADLDGVASVRLFFEEVPVVLPQLEAAYQADPPDLVVYDTTAFHAPMLAAKWGVPEIQLSPTHVLYDGVHEESGARPSLALRTLREEIGGAETPAVADPKPCVVTIPRAFQVRADRVGAHCTFVGPMLSDRDVHGGWSAPEDGRRVALVSLGSVYGGRPEFFRICAEAFADLDWHVVMPIGRFFDRAELGELPPNIEVHRWVPQLKVLARASAFVTHAGLGGTMEALASGVPLIAVPRSGDQFVTGVRIAEIGLAGSSRNRS